MGTPTGCFKNMGDMANQVPQGSPQTKAPPIGKSWGFGEAAHNVINTPVIEGYLDNLANAATNNSAVMAILLAKLDELTNKVNTMQQQHC